MRAGGCCHLLGRVHCSCPVQNVEPAACLGVLFVEQLGACAQIKAKENKAKANPALAAENKVRCPAFS